jgi:catechol 2,3-dioxygenase-like lactoylglutathione lyase family enzyme
MPKVNGIVETALHVADVGRSREFYQSLFGFDDMAGTDRFCALHAGPKQVLLLFRKGGSTEPIAVPGGLIPPHDGTGRMHVGFAISESEYDGWLERLTNHGIAIESEVKWPLGGRSIYFRDADQHLLELITPGVWSAY